MLKTKQKILAAILRESGIHVNGLMKRVGSVRDIKSILDALESGGLIYSKYTGNVRQLYPNLLSEESLSVCMTVEAEEKNNKVKSLKPLQKIDKRAAYFHSLIGNNLHSIVVFGSAATGTLSPESDIDLLFILAKEADKITELKVSTECRVLSKTIGREINPVFTTVEAFRKQLAEKTSFAARVAKERLVLFGAMQFLSMFAIENLPIMDGRGDKE